MGRSLRLAGLLRHFLLTLHLNFRSRQALVYGYLVPVFFLLAFGSVFRNDTPLLLHINMDAGHGGASGRYDYLKEIAFDYAFLLRELGMIA